MHMRDFSPSAGRTVANSNRRGQFRILLAVAVAIAGAPHSYADSIVVLPSGLAPGSEYRLVFVTDGTYTATSANINDYNAEVAADANWVPVRADLAPTWDFLGAPPAESAMN